MYIRSWTAILACLALIASACGGSSGDASSASEEPVYLEAASDLGQDPFLVEAVTVRPDPAVALPVDASRTVDGTAAAGAARGGGDVGLYGGSTDRAVCDQAKMIEFLTQNSAKAQAWVSAFNADATFSFNGGSLSVADIPAYINSLVPVVLTADTRVTNHGFKDGNPTPRQSVIQKGTAVLVDAFGVPRVKCLCGNPLLPPRQTNAKYEGNPWPDFQPNNTVTVSPHPQPLPSLPTVNISTGQPLPILVPTPPGTTTPANTPGTTTPANTPGTGSSPQQFCTLPDGSQWNRGDNAFIGNDTGSVQRVNDDCSTTLVNCYSTDTSGGLQTASPGQNFVAPDGNTYTFNADCSFDTGAPATGAPSTGAATCQATLPDGTLYNASPPEELISYRNGVVLTDSAGTVFEVGERYEIDGSCNVTLIGCTLVGGFGRENPAAFGDTFDVDADRYTIGPDCSVSTTSAAPPVQPAPPTTNPAAPANQYCTPAPRNGDPVDITFINNSAAPVYLWYHDENCTPTFLFGPMLPGEQLVQSTFTDDVWSLNLDDGTEVSSHAAQQPGAQTWCADPNAVC
ncbi:MAG: DUF6777 domain-containing protein [Actinomycetota bacterium]